VNKDFADKRTFILTFSILTKLDLQNKSDQQ